MKRRWLKTMAIVFALLCSNSSLFGVLRAEAMQSEVSKTIRWQEDMQAFHVKLNMVSAAKTKKHLYVALLVDSSSNMKRLRDVWDHEQGWISRQDAIEFSTKEIVNQISNLENVDVHLGAWAFDSATFELTNGFQAFYDDEKQINSHFDVNDMQFFMNNYTVSTMDAKTHYASTLRAVYEAFADAPQDAEKYVLMITGNDDGAKARSQQYAAALKAPENQTVLGIGAGRNASIWTVLIGHENNVNPTHWQSDYLITDVDISAGYVDGLEWKAWQTDAPHILNSRRKIANAEPHLITLSLQPEQVSYDAFPADASLHDVWQFYQTALQYETELKNGQNVHYAYSMSSQGDEGVQLDENDRLEHHFGYQYTRGLVSMKTIMERFSDQLEKDSLLTLNAEGHDLYNSAIFSLYQPDAGPAVQLTKNGQACLAQTDWSQNGQIDWEMEDVNVGDHYILEYFLKLNVLHESVQNQPVGESGYIEYVDGTRVRIPVLLIPEYVKPQNPDLNGENSSGGAVNPPNMPKPSMPQDQGQNSAPSNNVNQENSHSTPTIGHSGNVLNAIVLDANEPVMLNDRNMNFNRMGTSPMVPPLPNKPANLPSPYTQEVPAEPEIKKEKIDAAETRRMAGKSLKVSMAKTKVYATPKEDSKVSLYLNEGKQFKIAGVTSNYYMIQYKRKDNKVRKGYIEKKDVSLI